MKHKLIRLALLASATTLALTGCGGGSFLPWLIGGVVLSRVVSANN